MKIKISAGASTSSVTSNMSIIQRVSEPVELPLTKYSAGTSTSSATRNIATSTNSLRHCERREAISPWMISSEMDCFTAQRLIRNDDLQRVSDQVKEFSDQLKKRYGLNKIKKTKIKIPT